MLDYNISKTRYQDYERELHRHQLATEAMAARKTQKESKRLDKIQGSIRTLAVAILTLLALYGGLYIFGGASQALGAPNQQTATDAKVPTYFNYQGTLRDPEGNRISGVRKMTFRVYANVAAPLPEAIWSEEHAEVTVRDGQFSVLLGNANPLPAAAFRSPDTFIGVTVDPYDEMVPRQRFASVPYALVSDYAHDADTLDGQHAEAFASAGHTHNFLSAGDGEPGQAVYVADDGKVGINTQSPQADLHIAGAESDGITSATLKVQNGTTTMLVDGNEIDSQDTLYLNTNSNRNVSLAASGNVGIGTKSPAKKLDVSGDVRITGNLSFGAAAKPPILLRRFTNLGSDSTTTITGVSPNDYECTVGAWSIRMDIDEDEAGPFTLWTYVEGENWKIRHRFYTDSNEQVMADVICYLKSVVDNSGFATKRTNGGHN